MAAPEYKHKPEGYKTGDRVTFKGSIFEAAFWAGTLLFFKNE